MKIFSKMTIAQLKEADGDFEWLSIDQFSLVAEDNGLTSIEGKPAQVAYLMEEMANTGAQLDEVFV